MTTAAEAFMDQLADLVADRVVDRMRAAPQVQQTGFSPREAGTYLGCSERHVRSLIEKGTIPATRLGERVVIHRQALDRLLLGEDGPA